MATFICPDCDSKFRANPAPGMTVTCPECDFRFRPEEDEEDDRPAPRSRRREESGGNTALLIGVIAGGGLLLLLGLGGVAVWMLAAKPAAPADAPAAVPQVADAGAIPAQSGGPAFLPNQPQQQTPAPQPQPKQPLVAEPPNSLVAKTRRATALIRVSNGNRAASGSGFLMQVNGDTAYVITNFHVIDLDDEPPPQQQQPKNGPPIFGPPRPPSFPGGGPPRPPAFPAFPTFPGRPGTPQPKATKPKTKVTVVLDSATPQEQSLIGTKESIAPLQAVLDGKPHFMVGPAATEALKAVQARAKE
jgi:hypothetical protein